MAKQGMKRPEYKKAKKGWSKNDVTPVSEIQGKAKKGHEKAKPQEQ